MLLLFLSDQMEMADSQTETECAHFGRPRSGVAEADQPKNKRRQGKRSVFKCMKSPSMTKLPPSTTRWVASRKVAVVAAVSNGMVTLEEACHRYQMSEEEFFAWRRAFENFGIRGLHVGCVQQQRGLRPSGRGDPSPGQITPAPNEDSAEISWT